ncbi:MAG: aminopeptidase N [Rhodocyclaceae bacterium]
MDDAAAQAVHLKDYTPPPFAIDTVDLDIEVRDDHARVRSRLVLQRNPAGDRSANLRLDGEQLELESVALDGRVLAADEFRHDANHLALPGVPDQFELEIVNLIRPFSNTKLMGLYASATGLFTQCEPEGMRRITYFLDRPDVMARYTTTIRADKARYPVLLSNGNLIDSGDLGDGRHWARWQDPFPKPSYLFAMVAAKLDKLEDRFTTRSGRQVQLAVYVEPGKLDQCGFAMEALKRAMRWDEQAFGLEVDLDRYMIVAVGDFSAGAMENKGLNIFNTRYVLARPDTATDSDFEGIDRVVAHEYFHNWTGNRVTCRDWFQLSLKEGLTVFRDQEFGADTYSRPVVRIQDARDLRRRQFAEDAGPMAHPVRPDSYLEISNFYTSTVYEKGAEVVRMIHTLIGADAFRRGMGLYFQRHDGQAVTTEDFVKAMEDAGGADLAQFRLWYEQAGTPVLHVRGDFDAASARYTLSVRQSCPPTPGQPDKRPFHIPLAVGLVGADGRDQPLQLEGENAPAGTTRVLSIRAPEESFTFVGIAAGTVPSLLRGFSAPVRVDFPYTEADLTHLMAWDADSFARWEAGQQLATDTILRGADALKAGRPVEIPPGLIRAFARLLADAPRDPAFAAEALCLPDEITLAERMEIVDPDALHQAWHAVAGAVARELRSELLVTYAAQAVRGAYSPDAVSAGKRALRNQCLEYLMELDEAEIRALCVAQFEDADNMTDALAALSLLADCHCPERTTALASFYDRWRDEPLVVDKWFAVQAASRLPDTLDSVRRLTAHPAFEVANPNKVYALIRTFCSANHVRFHAADGAGYRFAVEQILALDKVNPGVAARIARSFDRWQKFDAGRQAHARAALERILASPELSKDVSEIVRRALA